MCGIFGIIALQDDFVSPGRLQEMTSTLFCLSESRGKEAAGILFLKNATISSYKEPVSASIFTRSPTYQQFFSSESSKPGPFVIMGHARLATNGSQTQNCNNQPVVTQNTVGVHNGIVVNEAFLWKKIKKKPKYEIDTEALFELINFYVEGGYLHKGAIQKAYQDIEGSASVAMLFQYADYAALATNTGSLYAIRLNSPKALIFASESYILKKWKQKHRSDLSELDSGVSTHIHAGKGLLVNLRSLAIEEFQIDAKLPKPKFFKDNTRIYKLIDYSDQNAVAEPAVMMLYQRLNDIKKIKQHDFDYKAIYALRRCSRCILPETTPFISFDGDGVCSYCREHRKIEYKGRKALEKLIEPYRSKDGEPDCIIAFSGGRDSSYGLHYLKKELGLNPIAFTYDWGMVTDLARRNEARMVGKLGVEHIIVSADTAVKRDHIRKNILAWMKKPDLGMVPLFMQGDKQCESYIDRLARRNNIKLIFFCRGNEYEREEFKAGHCGVKDADPGGVIHDLASVGKAKIAFYYGLQYFRNPNYINSSLFDTLSAYFITYIQKHNYIFFWHYIPWDEKTIIETLTHRYNWETSPEQLTWRTDDGSPAFYNYIYYQVQGFTENDSFRARQVREGKLARKNALEIIQRENKPRYEALKWYFDRVGLDGDEVLTAVDNMPRLYGQTTV